MTSNDQPQWQQPTPAWQPPPPQASQPSQSWQSSQPTQQWEPPQSTQSQQWAAPPPQPWQQPGSSSEPAPASGSWSSQPGYVPAGPTTTVKRGRPWLVAIVSFITMLVLIAGVGNQWVTDKIQKNLVGSSFADNVKRAMLTYQWRFSPRGGSDFARVWLSSICLVATVLVLTFLLVAVICRGKGGFWQAFFGAWFTVLFATIVGKYVQVAVIDSHKYLGDIARGGKQNVIFFSQLSPSAVTIAAGLGFGIVVGLAAGLTALISRQTEVIASPVIATGYPSAPPEPAYGPESSQPAESGYATDSTYAPVPGPMAAPSAWSSSEDTTAMPRTDAAAEDGATEDRATEDRATEDRATEDRATEDTGAATAPAEERARDEQSDATTTSPDEPQQTAVLPTVDEPYRPPADDSQQTTQLPRSSGTADSDDDSGPRHLSQ